MKLLREIVEDVGIITEDKDGKKTLYIEGIFMQSGIKNRNGRIYPKMVMEKEVNRYIKEHVQKGRAFGELTHPNSPTVNLKDASHVIKSLKYESNGNVYGKAQIIDAGEGLVARGLLEAGANLGVSSRGLGSLKEGSEGMEVQEDFHLVTPADIVCDPSAPDAWVQCVMEESEWFYDEKRGWTVAEQAHIAKEIMKPMNTRQIEEAKLILFERFLEEIKSGAVHNAYTADLKASAGTEKFGWHLDRMKMSKSIQDQDAQHIARKVTGESVSPQTTKQAALSLLKKYHEKKR